jgi:pimeloyl-ACP methyl ester carboxylesterase
LAALIAVGEREMADFYVAAETLTHALPGAAPATIPGAGHLAPLERQRELTELLLRFLSGVSTPDRRE